MRYFIGLIITLGLLVLLIVLILSDGGGKPANKPLGKPLYEYASTDAQTILTIDGPINAESLHQQVRITVDNAEVTYEHIQGYQGNAVDTHIFANNQDAYDAFLHALMHEGFTAGNDSSKLKDGSGYCPTGQRYTFELTQDGNTLKRYWSTSCGNVGTYLGNTKITLELFQAQVPGYQQLTQNIDLTTLSGTANSD